MSAPWPLVKLGELLTQNTEYIEPEPRMYPKLSVKLYGKGVILDAPADGASLKMKRHQLAKPGQVILSEIWGKRGAIGFVPPEGAGALCTSHFYLFDVNYERLEPNWLQLIFDANYLEGQLGAVARGTTGYASVRPKTLLACEIPLPPLDEQRRIVARIEELAKRVEKCHTQHMYSVAESDIIWMRTARLLFDDLIGKYPVTSLANCVTVKGGGTPSKADPMNWNGSIPWISPKDIKSFDIFDSIDHITLEATETSSAKIVQPGAVLIVVRGMILAHTVPVAILRVPGTINQDMKALSPREGISSEFLGLMLWAFNEDIVSLVEKSTHDTRKLTTKSLLSLEIPTPPVDVQSRITPYLQGLRSKIEEVRHEQRNVTSALNTLMPSILDRAFKGEL